MRAADPGEGVIRIVMVAGDMRVAFDGGFFAGWGLLQREPWARVLTLILAFLALIHVPFGTVLGVYTLWVLLPAGAEEEYEKYRQASAA